MTTPTDTAHWEERATRFRKANLLSSAALLDDEIEVAIAALCAEVAAERDQRAIAVLAELAEEEQLNLGKLARAIRTRTP